MTALMDRARLVRNALFCYYLAVGIFVATSLFIGFDVLAPSLGLRPYLLGLFLVGMCVVFSGIVFATLDTLKGYRVVEFEVMVDE
jgi:hypothetical protein